MNIKRNIIFALESRKKAGVPIVENVPIRMRVVFAGQRIEFTTDYRIDTTKWDADKQKVKNGCTNKLKQSASEINTDLLRQYTEIQNVFKEYEVQDILPTVKQIKDAFNARMRKQSAEVKEAGTEDPTISFWEAFGLFFDVHSSSNLAAADFTMPEIHYFWLSQVLQCSKYIISSRRGFCSARNTLFLAAADFAMLEIHYFWLSQILQCPKYTISGRRGFCSARNTLFLAVAGFAMPEIHYFWPPQNLQRSKYIISGCRRFATTRRCV